MCSPAGPKILYRNSRLLRLAFLQLHRQQRSGTLCDVLLQAEGEAVPAHSCVLSACSPFFTERLEQEQPAQGRQVVLQLGGLKISTLRKLVNFLYTSEMEASREEVRDILAAARRFRVLELESLQLEGSKLVKASQGRRLNRECLQAPPVSARLPGPGIPPQAPLPKAPAPRPPGAGRLKLLGGTADGPQKKGGPQGPRDQAGTPRGCPVPVAREETGAKDQAGSFSLGNQHQASWATTPGPPVLAPSVFSPPGHPPIFSPPGHPVLSPLSPYSPGNDPLPPRKIKLSRSKPSTGADPSRSPGSVSGSSPARPPANRRVWRKRSGKAEEAEERREPGGAGAQRGGRNPPDSGEARKRSPEARAAGSDSAEEGQVGRVKLRKIVNGSCWEVVQEPPPGDPGPDGPREAAPGPDPADPSGPRGSHGLRDPSTAETGPPGLPMESLEGPIPDRDGARPDPAAPPGLPLLGEGLGGSLELDAAPPDPPFEAEEYGITSTAATIELEEILDFMFSGTELGAMGDALEHPREGSAEPPPAYPGPQGPETWGQGEEWFLPDLELWPKALELEEPCDAEEESVIFQPLSPLALTPSADLGELLPGAAGWTPGPGVDSVEAAGDRGRVEAETPARPGPDAGSPTRSQRPPAARGLPCAARGAASAPPEGDPVRGAGGAAERQPLPPVEEDQDIDVVDWVAQVGLVPIGGPCVWPDPSSESETEVDVLT
ncbi:BTB/POZ domain-containing protein 18 [Tachyglossus aculeatus]|uniref:BTB/POZ domain-containing protein 18 n=1 Tax=Tachyglossus aculeatus TaxID=9261 RepID=UPI0018F3B17B|nr:BTB/POZ domain-containing protein 18 [Tachyglossus aculeatus]